MTEVELSQEGVVLEGEPSDIAPPVTNKNEKKVLTVDSGASAVSSGQDLNAVLADEALKSPEQIKKQRSDSFVQEESFYIEEGVKQTATEEPDNLPLVLESARNNFQQLQTLEEDGMTPYLGWVNSLQGSETLTKDERFRLAADTKFLSEFAKIVDEQSAWGSVTDFLGMLAVPDESANVASLESKILGEKLDFQGWLGSQGGLERIAQFRNTLSNEELVQFDNLVTEYIKDVDDNTMQQYMLAMGVLGRDKFTDAVQAMEKVDLASIAGTLGLTFMRALRGVNVLNRVGKAGDPATAVKVAEVATKGANKEIGVNVYDAASLGNPVADKNIFNGAPEGLQEQYRYYQGEVTDALDRASDTLGFSISPDAVDKEKIVASLKKNFNKDAEIDNLEFKWGVEGLQLKYDVVEDGVVQQQSLYKTYTLDDLGGLVDKDASIGDVLTGGVVFSPNKSLRQDRKLFVEDAQAGEFAKNRLTKAFYDATDAALKPVKGNKNSLRKIDKVLKMLDGTDTDITYHKLVREGVGGIKLTENEFLAVLGTRRVLDDAWNTNNSLVRRGMELRGAKSIDFNGEVSYGRDYDTPESAYTAFSTDANNQLVRDVDGSVLAAPGLDVLEEAYRNGRRLVVADGGNELEWFQSSQGLVRYALVDQDNIKALPHIVLNRVKNYLPKMYNEANFFVKERTTRTVNGKETPSSRTLAYASTRSQAEAWLAKLKKTTEESGEVFDPEKYDINFDREVATSSSEVISQFGGLIRGKRSSRPLEYAGDVTENKRVNALDAIQRYMGITADRVAMEEWRMEATTRLRNQASLHPEIGDKAHSLGLQELGADINAIRNDPKGKAKLRAAYNQVYTMTNMPTKSDLAFQASMKMLGEQFDKMGWEGMAKAMYNFRDKSLVDAIKGGAFNLTLGTFSLVQIPVQLFGAAVAYSINPMAAGRATPKWLMSSTLDLVTEEKTARAFLRKFSGDLGLDEKTVANDYAFWRKSGMYESVVRGNADASSLANRLPYDAGFLRRGFDKVVDAGQTPYRMGELANMRISFFTALEHIKDVRGAKFKYDDKTLQDVLARAENYRLNMGPANKAQFQKGIWSLPTQFKQIYTKYLEAQLFGSQFTKPEKAKMFMGQIMLFGAAGVPIVNHFADDAISAIWGEDVDNLSTDELALYKRGAMGWYLNESLGIDALFSGRLTVSADILEDLSRAFFDEKTTMLQTAMGASFTSGDKLVDLFQNMAFAGGLAIEEYTEGEARPEVWNLVSDIMVRSLANIPSSSRKWMAAHDLHNGIVRRSDGTPLYAVEEYDILDIYARGIGFGSQEMDDLYKLSLADRKIGEKTRNLAGRYVSVLYDLQQGVDKQDEAHVLASQVSAKIIADQINQLPEYDRDKVYSFIQKRITNPKDFKEETIKKALEVMNSQFVDSANKASIEKRRKIEELEGENNR